MGNPSCNELKGLKLMKCFFRVSPLVAILMLSSFVHQAAGALMPGDIAIIGMQNDNTDEFSWVPLVNISAGEVIFFSDAGFNSATGTTFQGDTAIGDELVAFQSTDDPTMATFGQMNFTPLFQIDSGSDRHLHQQDAPQWQGDDGSSLLYPEQKPLWKKVCGGCS